MNSFHQSADGPRMPALERLLAQKEGQVKEVYGPLGALSVAITTAAWETQQSVGHTFGFSTRETPSEPQMLLQYELLYFFAHLALRTVSSEGFTELQIAKVQAFLGPLLASTAVDAFCAHWPEHLKKKMMGEVFDRLNDAEMEYAECSGLLEQADPLNTGTLIGKLSANSMALWDREPQDPAAFEIAVAATDAALAMQLKEHVRAVAAVIDRVDVESIKAFWR